MGAAASLSHLPEQVTKSECMVLAGSLFSEEHWREHSSGEVMSREALLRLYSSRVDGLSHRADELASSFSCLGEDPGNTSEMVPSPDKSSSSSSAPRPPPKLPTSKSQCNDIATKQSSATVPETNSEESIYPPVDCEVVRLIAPDGLSSYEGNVLDGKPHGYGKFTFKSGAYYDGHYCEGRKHGNGTFLYPTGAVYSGEWRNDKKHGYGEYTLPSGDTYKGNWENNCKCGEGEYLYASVDGGRYSGDWKDNRKHGIGTYYYSNGDSYTGYWLLGKKHGHGKYTYSTGEVYDGDWNANKMHGYGKFSDATGKIAYEGEYRHGSIFNFLPSSEP